MKNAILVCFLIIAFILMTGAMGERDKQARLHLMAAVTTICAIIFMTYKFT